MLHSQFHKLVDSLCKSAIFIYSGFLFYHYFAAFMGKLFLRIFLDYLFLFFKWRCLWKNDFFYFITILGLLKWRVFELDQTKLSFNLIQVKYFWIFIFIFRFVWFFTLRLWFLWWRPILILKKVWSIALNLQSIFEFC